MMNDVVFHELLHYIDGSLPVWSLLVVDQPSDNIPCRKGAWVGEHVVDSVSDLL